MLIGVVCSDHGIVVFARILRTIFNMLLIIGPILCIVSLIISCIMIIKSENADKKSVYTGKMRNSIIAILITIFLPVLVNVVMGMTFMKDKFQIASCWDEAYNTKLEGGYGDYSGEGGSGENDTLIIKPEQYNDQGTTDDPNASITSSTSTSAGTMDSSDILKACEVQAEWMKNYHYEWQSNPTIEKSKKKGTCVTYVACVLQRIGALNSGEFVWINKKSRVVGANSKMEVTYLSGTLKSNKSKFESGDIVIGGNGNIDAGGGSHIFIMTGEWDGNNPYIYDQGSADKVRQGKNAKHTWNGGFKVIARIRLSN